MSNSFFLLITIAGRKAIFGAGEGTIITADYTGNLHDKLKALATVLCVLTTQIVEAPDEIAPTGDGGLDWVGWMPFADNCDHQPVYFGQCACGANWIDKQHETSLSVWQNFYKTILFNHLKHHKAKQTII